MGSPPPFFLKTKLNFPFCRQGLVPRRRLTERVEEGLKTKLLLISAPAGSGKTSLLANWRATSSNAKFPMAWVSLEETDNDLGLFWIYIASALEYLQPGVGESSLSLLKGLQPVSLEIVLAELINSLENSMPDHFALVLEDYHFIKEPSIHQTISFLLDHLPSRMHLVVNSRSDPPFSLSRFRARAEMVEIRAQDLRFRKDEIAEFLIGLNLTEAQLENMEARTEGWVAGLQLAAISLRECEDVDGFIRAFTGSHRLVLDYLVEEVLQHQPERVRSFLLQTAILDRLSGSLCDAVTGQEEGRVTLDTLERGNLFIVPLDERRQWYRYHHLFGDVLQVRVMEEQPQQVPALHRRASAWYEQHGMPPEAIRNAMAARDFERAASLIELAGPMVEESSQNATWLGWVRGLPDDLVGARPVLSVWYAYALLGRGEMEAAEARLTNAERWLELVDNLNNRSETPSAEMVVVDEDQFRSLPATINVARAYIAQALGDVPGTVRYAQRVLNLLPEGKQLRRGQAFALLGITYWANGDLEAAGRTFADFAMRMRTAGNISDAISATCVLAEIRMAQGFLREAVNTLEHLLRFVSDQGESVVPDTADLYRGLSELYLEQGKLDAAIQHLLRSKELGEQTVLPVWWYRWCVARARLSETQGDLDGALTWLDEAECWFIRSPLPDVHPIAAMKARIWVIQGRLTEALGWVHAQGLSTDEDLRYLREFEHITLTRVFIAHYRHNPGELPIGEAMNMLVRLLNAAEEGSRMLSVIEILVLQALAQEAQNDIASALMPLERALLLAQTGGYIRLFMNEGPSMARLLDEAALRGIHLDYVNQLRAAIGQVEGRTSGTQPLIDPLSQRELEVLRLLRTELRGPEIARTLVVSLSTVRTHTQSIYNKLGVNNRQAAVRRAEELHLL